MSTETILKVPAIHCNSCVKTVTRTLEALPSVQVTQVDPESKQVHLQFDGSVISLDRIREGLDEVGFSPDD